ncbi:MAG: FtsQ-type POTRA domain-containing protein, partial [Bacteroidota bacterium]|nr:FtsQ-type POTRA domain-containing protein [Bacteroidota bacterium]
MNRKIIFIFILLAVAALVIVSIKWRSGNTFDKITLNGNYTIPREEILGMSRLKDSLISREEIDIDLIEDRISKHPEVKKVYVSIELPSELKIEIIERRPVAILNGENEIKLIDNELDIFPFKNSSKMYDLPVISGIRIENNPNPIKKYNKEDLRLALFMILNTYNQSRMAYNNISEINLSDTGKA